MAEPILLDRFRNDSYNQNQIINDKLDFLIGEMRDMKQDIRALDKKIETVRTELKADIDKVDEKIDNVETRLDKKIDNVRTELKTYIDNNHAEVKAEINLIKNEITTSRWQIFGVVVAQICSIGAIVWAIVSAVK